MNRKGFTLIELLAVIVILGIIAVMVVPAVISYYEESKIKSEEIFIKRLTQVIDDYLSVNSSSIEFSTKGEEITKWDGDTSNCSVVTVYENSDVITLANLMPTFIGENDLINPNGKNKCNKNTRVSFFRDTNMRYCFKVTLDCVDDDETTIRIENEINTCGW